jgi:hypothetical protein
MPELNRVEQLLVEIRDLMKSREQQHKEYLDKTEQLYK